VIGKDVDAPVWASFMDFGIQYRFLRALILTLGGALLVSGLGRAQNTDACVGTKEQPVLICFDDPPLTVDHNKGEIDLHFHVGLFPFDNGIQPAYYFTYQLAKDGAGGQLENPLDSKFLLTEADPLPQAADNIHIPYQGSGNFSVMVSVYAEGRDPVTLTSPVRHLGDSVRVTALLVGVSHYASTSIPQLTHSDEDAKSFDTFLKAIFPDGLQTTLLTSDASDPSKKPTVKNIADAFSAERFASNARSNDDWFIFYFSGHGVVGSDEATVGNKGAVATHYLSTTLLDPTDLDTTAIPIEEIFSWVRNIKAGNKIVILDSCFSGSSKRFHPGSTGRSGAKDVPPKGRSHKVAYVFGKGVVDPYEFASRNPNTGTGDLLAFKETAEKEDADGKRDLYLSAAFSDHEAEEGFEQYSQPGLDFTPSDEEKDEQKAYGHGLYTFVLLWNLLSQLPKESVLPEILKGQKPVPTAVGSCQIDFSSAHLIGAGDIARLQRASKATDHPRDYQTPDVAGHTQTIPPMLPCNVQIPSSSGSQHESPR
jgi:hypothetical protein